jgi:hypothetical protein
LETRKESCKGRADRIKDPGDRQKLVEIMEIVCGVLDLAGLKLDTEGRQL